MTRLALMLSAGLALSPAAAAAATIGGLCGGDFPPCQNPPPSAHVLPAPVVSYGLAEGNGSNSSLSYYSTLNDGVHQANVGGTPTDYITTGGSAYAGPSGGSGGSGGGSVGVASIQSTLGPVASVTASAGPQGGSYSGGPSNGASSYGKVGLIYRVTLSATDESSADVIRALLGTNGDIATVSGVAQLSAIGQAYSSAEITTGDGIFAADGSIADSLYQTPSYNPPLEARATFGCDASGAFPNLGSGGCGTSNFTLALNFVSATTYGGSDLDFIGNISLLSVAGEGGDFQSRAFIDPTVTLNTALGSNYSLTLGAGAVANASGISAAPEPGTWALLLSGVGVMGWTLRRNRRRLANS